MHVRRVDLANLALRTSPKFTTGVKYQFHQVFHQIRDLEIPITLRPHFHYRHQCSAQWQALHCKRRNQGCSSAEGRSFTVNSGTNVAILPGINWCGSFPLLSAPYSLFSIWTYLKRSEKIPGAPTWKWGEWIRLTWPSGLHRNSPQGLNISSIRVFDQVRDPVVFTY